MGNDLRQLNKEDKEILLNKRLLSINRDPLGVWGQKVEEKWASDPEWGLFQAFVKPVTPIDPNGSGCPSFAVLYLSRRIIGREWPVSVFCETCLALIYILAFSHCSCFNEP